MDQYEQLIDQNEIVLRRLRGVAAVDEQTLLDLGVTGPLLRAAGNPWDLRKAAPYSSYDHFEFKIPVDEVIDVMGEIGREMDVRYRETAGGGLAATPTGRRLAKERLYQIRRSPE